MWFLPCDADSFGWQFCDLKSFQLYFVDWIIVEAGGKATYTHIHFYRSRHRVYKKGGYIHFRSLAALLRTAYSDM
jgi:hypothetical protein